MTQNWSKIYGLLVVVGVITLVMFPYIWLGQDVKVNLWDNLDSNVAWYKMLKVQDKIFAGPEVMVDGMVLKTPRFSYPTGYNIELGLVYLFDIFTAYWMNKLLIVLLAFFSMCFFLKKVAKKGHEHIIEISLIWATLAFYPHRGASIALLPLVFVVFEQLRKRKNIAYVFFLFAYALYSMFVLAGFYIWVVFLFISIFWMIKDKKFNGYLLCGLLLWMVTYFIVDSQLIYFLFGDPFFVSHRQEMSYLNSIWTGLYPWDFFMGRDHSGAMYWWGYPLIALGFMVFLFRDLDVRHNVLFFGSVLLLIAIFCSAVSLLPWVDLMGKLIPNLHSLNLLRFKYFIPFSLFALVAIGFVHLEFKGKKLALLACIGINLFIYQYEWRNWLNDHLDIHSYRVPTYEEYYSKDLYNKIKEYLGDDAHKATFGHVNLPPAVSVFNGLIAVDGYLQNYDVEHKIKIRKVIGGELEKDRDLAGHFNDWGNKCYLQNATYPDQFDAYKWKNLAPIDQLDFDFRYLNQELKVDYLLSAVEIKNKNLTILKIFKKNNSAWEIYLYKIL